MTEQLQVGDSQTAVDVTKVFRAGYATLTSIVVVRFAITAALVAAPFAMESMGIPDSFFTALPFVAAVLYFLYTLQRVGSGVRLRQCARVLRHYPLEYREWAKQKECDRLGYGSVYTVRLARRESGRHPTMQAINASSSRRWPKGAEDGVWFAGDDAFGGVMIVPERNAIMFMIPADWDGVARKREAADATRWERAKLAHIDRRNWRRPNLRYGL